MQWFNPKKAFWLPNGSIRAVLAIGIVGSFLYACLASVRPEVIGTLAGVAVMVVKDYFDHSKTQTKRDDNNV